VKATPDCCHGFPDKDMASITSIGEQVHALAKAVVILNTLIWNKDDINS
jgi:hypothetical protein